MVGEAGPERAMLPREIILTAASTFAGAMVRTKDLDPLYPVLRWLNQRDDGDPEHLKRADWTGEAHHLRRTMLYVAFYNIAASECVMEAQKRGNSKDVAQQLAGRAGVERRGLRSPAFMIKHLDFMAAKQEEYGGFDEGMSRWLRWRWQSGMTPAERWKATTDTLMDVPYNGRWAAYKACDILVEVHGWPMEAPDAGHRWSTGPREGLEVLAEQGVIGDLPEHTDQTVEAIERLDRATEAVQRELWERGVPLKMSEVETFLCNWKALSRGRYYIGHDIDELLDRVNMLPQSGEYAPVRKRLLAARRACFAPELLGELNGWIGVRRPLMGLFAQTGELVNVELGS